MSPGAAASLRDRALLALVAVFLPARAPSLLSRLGGAEAEPLLSEGTHLAALPRRERLLALAAVLAELQPSCAPSPAVLASGERPGVREALAKAWSVRGRLEANRPHPALTRLLVEASLGSGDRTAASGPPRTPLAHR